MPRLVGKQSNNKAGLGLLLIAVIATCGALEYSGVLDYIPNFGRLSIFTNQAQ